MNLKTSWIYPIIRKKAVSYSLRILSLRNYQRVPNIRLIEIIQCTLLDKFLVKGDYTLSNYGVWLKNNHSDRTFRLNLLGYRNNLENFLRNESRKMVFLDIGSNQGVFSLIAASNPHFVEIHSFEPNPKVFSYLKQNIAYANKNNVFLHEKAISKVNGKIGFSMDMSHSGAGKIDPKSRGLEVESINYSYLNAIIANQELPIFIKIDVEGAESEVLTQIRKMKNFSNVKSIFIELNENYSEVSLLLDFFDEFGFTKVYEKRSNTNCDGFFVRK